MELTESYTLPVPQQQAWEALNDTAILKESIPGCESIEADGDNAYRVSMRVVVGPVKAHFTGRMMLTDVDPPHTYTIVFEGQGGVAGFGKGTAKVTLAPDGEGATTLSYGATAQVGGKLAQIGSRLVDSAARKMASEFFRRFTGRLAGENGAAGVGAAGVGAAGVGGAGVRAAGVDAAGVGAAGVVAAGAGAPGDAEHEAAEAAEAADADHAAAADSGSDAAASAQPRKRSWKAWISKS